eukprot:TRINITY_DN80868_c0_g1_i1.p1 TRINITY_DN80868_c0_g1~~TRINITY_DN80868_c0_g1_i1.p1  ORF type:complete len:145 (+),score=11.80 TRINITY_DN80868_c0_g1_i1:47-481(+)
MTLNKVMLLKLRPSTKEILMNNLPINTTISQINTTINITINPISTINTIKIKGIHQTRESHQAMAKTCLLPHLIKCLLKFKTILKSLSFKSNSTFLVKCVEQLIVLQEDHQVVQLLVGVYACFASQAFSAFGFLLLLIDAMMWR